MINRLLFIIFITCILVSCNSTPGTILECGGGGEFSCPEGTFCNFAAECGGVDHKGTCQAVPEDCETKESLVCGCNGRTYSNRCMANAAKVSVDYTGACISKEDNKNKNTGKIFEFPSTKIDIDPSAVENAGDRTEQQYEDSLF